MKETMNVVDVVRYLSNNRKIDYATLFIMKCSGNERVCDIDGNMDTKFIRLALTDGEDDSLFCDLSCGVTTTVWDTQSKTK